MSKLYVDSKLGVSPRQLQLISEFCVYCAEQLPIEREYKIYVITDRAAHNIATTAAYHVGDNICKVYGKNRALVDILRSIAHEMTHMMQDEKGLITGHVRDAGGFHEDQANARAGELIKLFAKSKKGRKEIYENLKKRIRLLK
tara:strand:+ start:988 stop:1416 length:429 start_codon:yes stop_codon:yes gene_type:complete